jgi:hypothetical protein
MKKYIYKKNEEPEFLRHTNTAIEVLLGICILLAILHHVI